MRNTKKSPEVKIKDEIALNIGGVRPKPHSRYFHLSNAEQYIRHAHKLIDKICEIKENMFISTYKWKHKGYSFHFYNKKNKKLAAVVQISNKGYVLNMRKRECRQSPFVCAAYLYSLHGESLYKTIKKLLDKDGRKCSLQEHALTGDFTLLIRDVYGRVRILPQHIEPLERFIRAYRKLRNLKQYDGEVSEWTEEQKRSFKRHLRQELTMLSSEAGG